MIKHVPFTDSLLRSLSALVPELQILIANSKLIRGQTAKGRYDIRVWGEGTELRTSFLGRGRNPLKQSKILLRTPLNEETDIQEHAIASAKTNVGCPGSSAAAIPSSAMKL